MVRRTKEESAKTKEKILDTALVVFSEKGFSGSSLQEIAERAGFTRGAVYWHFKSKIDLLIALADDIEHGSGLMSDIDIDNTEDLLTVLSTYLRRFVTDQRYALFYRTIMLQTGWTGEVQPLAVWYQRDQVKYLAWLEKNVAQLQTSGGITSDRPANLIALSIAAFVSGLVEIWLIDPAALDMTTTAPELLVDHIKRLSP